MMKLIVVVVCLLISSIECFVVPRAMYYYSRRPPCGTIHTTTTTTTRRWSAEALTPEQEQARAKQVFDRFDQDGSGTISAEELTKLLRKLEIEVSDAESEALFFYLDRDGSGEISFAEFLKWYQEASGQANQISTSFQSILIGRRTVEQFDETPVNDDVLKRAIQCAIAAPNRSMSEPWRFYKVGPQTVEKLMSLRDLIHKNMETDDGESSVLDWSTIPGWCVVTTKASPDDAETELEDYKSTSCAIQNFMLSMWSEGIGTKWTSGPVQKTPEFANLVGIDTQKEKVVGCIWYGFAHGGLVNADPKRRKKGVDDVLQFVP